MSRRSRAAKRVAKEILLALHLKKPTLPLLLDGERFLELLDIQDENVTGGRLPSTGYVARLQAFTRTATAMLPAGRVVAWGNNEHGQTNVPDGLTDVIAIAAGGGYSLAIVKD